MARIAPALAGPLARRQGRSGAPSLRHVGVQAVFYVLMTLLAAIALMPLIWMVGASLKTEAGVLSIPPTFVPLRPLWHNYLDMWQSSIFSTFFRNSVKLALINVVGLLFVSSLAAYSFARLNFVGRDFAFSVLLSTVMVPGIVYLIPQYIIFRNFGWINTHYPLWVPRVFTPVFATFLLRQFFKTLPIELEDAAKIDGASTFRIYWQIMLPQVKPALAAVGVFTFIDSWNDLFGPLIFLNKTELMTLPVGLALFRGEFFTQVNFLMAGATLTTLPVLVIYFASQKYFVQGITLSGIRG